LSALPNVPPNPEPPQLLRGKSPARRWQRIAVWTLAALAGIVVIAVVGVAALLHNQRFHNYVLTKVQQSASESLGVPVELQNYALHFSGISPAVDIYGLVVHGAAPYANPPFLQVEQARVGVRVVSLLRKTWYLSEFTVHHPVVQVRVDADGNSNLPKPKQSSSSSNGIQPLFDLAVRHATLDQGEIYYNDRKSALDADLRELTLIAAYDAANKVYGGQIGYSDGQLKSGSYDPIPHALNAVFQITPTQMELSKAELRSGSSMIAFTATLNDFNNPRIAAVYHASVSATEIRHFLKNSSLPFGVLQLDGHVAYASKPNEPALNSATLTGSLRSDRLEFRQPTMRAEIRTLRATYSLSDGNAEIGSLTASLLGGNMDARATVKNVAGDQVGTARVKLNNISLASLRQLANTTVGNPVTLGGTLQGASEVTWKGSPNNLLATADATVNAAVGSAQPRSVSTVPITGQVHAKFRNSDQQLTLTKSYLSTPRTTLTLDGSMGQRSQMNIALNVADLHELEAIAGIFSQPKQPFGLYGNAKFTGVVSGPTSAPRLAGDLSGANLRVRETEWVLLKAHLDASPSGAAIQGGQVKPASTMGKPQGNITFSGLVDLKQWSFGPKSPFQVTLNAERLDAAQLATLAGSTTPVSGTLNAQVQAHGTTLNPIGGGQIELVRASVAGEGIQSARVQFNGDGEAAHAQLSVSMPAGVTTGTVTYFPKQRGYDVQLQTRNFHLDQLEAIKARNISISGVMNLVASGRGTLDDPQLTASLDIPQLKAQGQTIDHLTLQANVGQHVANIALDTRAVNTNIRARATVQLTGDYVTNAVLDTQPIPLQPLVATYAPDQAEDVTGQTELHATLHGPLKRKESIEAHLVIPELSVHYKKSIDLAASGPIRADYVNGVLNLQRSGIKGTGTDLQFQGSLPLLDRTKPVALMLLGSVDLRTAQLFDPDITSSGQMQFNINSYGARTDPNFHGDVKLVNVSIATGDAPVGLSNGNGTLSLTNDRLNITNFEGVVGGGKVTAKGGIAYHPSLQFDLALAGQGIRVLYPDGVREGLSANVTLTGTPEQAMLRGQVNLDQLSFSPDFDLSSITALGGGVEEPPSRGFANNLQLNVALRSTQNVNLVSRTLSANGSANLRLTGTASQPVLLGRINLTSGDLVFQGNRYVLQGGVVDFINPSRTEPNINASVTTTIQQYNIGMRFEGPIEQLHTSYSSDPALPPADIINLIAFGKTQEATAAANAGSSSSLSPEQSIASAVSGQVTSRVEKIAGISHLSVDPTLGNSQQGTGAGATVTVQQRVTSKIFVTFSTDVTSTQRQVIQLEYQATPKVSLSGTRDQNGGFGFDTRITREW